MPRGAAPMKRPAAAQTGRGAKRPAVAPVKDSDGDSIQHQCRVVSQAVTDAEGFPQLVLDMLVIKLPETLSVPKEDRHPFQEEVIGMVGEVLEAVEVSAQAAVEAAESELSAAAETKARLEAAEQAATAAAASKAEAMEAAKTALADSSAAHKAAKAELAAAESEQKCGDAELEAASGKKGRLESVTDGILAPLKQGSLEPAQVKDKVAELLKFGADFSFDASLLTSLPTALGKAPAERGNFDNFVLQQVEAELGKCKAALTATIEGGEPAKQQRAAKVEVVLAKKAAADEAERTCMALLESAKSEHKDAGAALKAAAKDLHKFEPELQKAAADLQSAKEHVASFQKGALKAFRALQVRTALTPPAPAEVSAAADVPAALEQTQTPAA